ncbi:hypothetical protein OC844_002115 [Tilletia horrida]|nr:hypothetical protein OC844_002115 [Tilletia horrida]
MPPARDGYVPLGLEGQLVVLKRRRGTRLRNGIFLCLFIFLLFLGAGASALLLVTLGRQPWAREWRIWGSASRNAAKGRPSVFRGAGAVRPLSNRTVLHFKTGYSVLYDRMPMQLLEARPDIPHRVVYSDVALRIGEHEVIDILANSTQLSHHQSTEYKQYAQLQLQHAYGSGAPAVSHTGWRLDRFKFAPMTTHAWRTQPGMSWYVFADGDTYLFWSTLLRWLETSFGAPENTSLYLGYDEILNKAKNQYFGHGGAGYILSRKLMEQIHEGDPEGTRLLEDWRFGFYDCGDCSLGQHIGDLPGRASSHLDGGADLFHHDGLDKLVFRPRLWHTYLLSLHHNSAEQLNMLRQWERNFLPTLPEWDGVRQCDALFGLAPAFLRAPLLEYIAAAAAAAESGPSGKRNTSAGLAGLNRTVVQMEWHTDEVDLLECGPGCMRKFGGAMTVENCDRACDAHPTCYGWQLLTGSTCRLALHGFRIGARKADAASSYQKHISGWRIDRIAEVERRMPCAHAGFRRLADERGHGLQPGRSDTMDTGLDVNWAVPELGPGGGGTGAAPS